jgi:N-acetylglucosamine-6-sulfatase
MESRFWSLAIFLVLEVFSACEAQRPNIVYILTDDQDIKLDSLNYQKKLQKMMTNEGLFFDNAFVTTPICCPSRASILTGRYPHNTGTFENQAPLGCSSQSWRDRNENRTIGAVLSANGYKTGFFGKYLNQYGLKHSGVGPEHVPPGWDKWYALVGNSKYYNYDVSNDGKTEHHGSSYAEDYFTDRIKNESVDFIMSMKGKQSPFFMYISTPAPHGPTTPAPQYNHTYDGVKAPRTPSYGYPGTDKHWLISKGTPAMTDEIKLHVDGHYEDRIETLLSVEDLVEEVLQALDNIGVMEDTYVFYNSDHGFHCGQFNQPGDKRQPYEENIRVPLIVRGPDVPANARTSSIALSIDLYPTFLDLAGVDVPEGVDGMSLKNLVTGQKEPNWREDFLVEYYGEGLPRVGCIVVDKHWGEQYHRDCHNNTFLVLRTLSSSEDSSYSLYFENDAFPCPIDNHNFEEYYDLKQDNWQLKNEYDKLDPSIKAKKVARIKELYNCSGKSCHG